MIERLTDTKLQSLRELAEYSNSYWIPEDIIALIDEVQRHRAEHVLAYESSTTTDTGWEGAVLWSQERV